MYNTFKGKENLFSQATFSLASLLLLFCIVSCLLFSISPIVPYPHVTPVCAKSQTNQNTYHLHTLLAVVRLFPFHFTNPFWLHTFLICPILVPSTFFRCRRIPKCQTTFPGMLHFKKHSCYVITSGSQTEGKIKSHNYTSTDTVIYT